MTKKLCFILINLLVLGSQEAFSMDSEKEEKRSPALSLRVSSQKRSLDDDRGLSRDVMESDPTRFKKEDQSVFLCIQDVTVPVSCRYALATSLFKGGSLEERAQVFPLLSEMIQNGLGTVEDRLQGALLIFRKGTPPQKEAGFSMGDAILFERLKSILAQPTGEKEQICDDLSRIMWGLDSLTKDRVRAACLISDWGSAEYKEVGLYTLTETIKDPNISPELRLSAMSRLPNC